MVDSTVSLACFVRHLFSNIVNAYFKVIGKHNLLWGGPKTTSRVTLAGVTRITPGNSGSSNSMLAVNRVANALGSSYSVLFTSVTHHINECLGITVRFVALCGAFRGFWFIKTRFNNLDINEVVLGRHDLIAFVSQHEDQGNFHSSQPDEEYIKQAIEDNRDTCWAGLGLNGEIAANMGESSSTGETATNFWTGDTTAQQVTHSWTGNTTT